MHIRLNLHNYDVILSASRICGNIADRNSYANINRDKILLKVLFSKLIIMFEQHSK